MGGLKKAEKRGSRQSSMKLKITKDEILTRDRQGSQRKRSY